MERIDQWPKSMSVREAIKIGVRCQVLDRGDVIQARVWLLRFVQPDLIPGEYELAEILEWAHQLCGGSRR